MGQIGSIIRIDKPKNPSGGATHGWQVRLPTGEPRKYKSKMFSDNSCGGPEQARKTAEKYLAENQRHARYATPAIAPYFERPPGHNRSGVVGVYRSHSYHKSGRKQEFWAAFCPIGPEGGRYIKRFYINEDRDEEEALRLAIEFRTMWEEAADKGESGWL